MYKYTLILMILVVLVSCDSKDEIKDEPLLQEVTTVATSSPTTTTAPPTTPNTTTPATATSDEPPCECGRCWRGYEWGLIEDPLSGEGISVCKNLTCTNTELTQMDIELAQRAAQLLFDLDRDYENAIGQIKFGKSECIDRYNSSRDYNPRDFVKRIHNNTLTEIWQIIILHIQNDGTLPMHIYVFFEEYETKAEIGVEFLEEDGEWIINNVYSGVLQH